MNRLNRDIPDDNFLWWLYGEHATQWFWTVIRAGGGYYDDHHLTVTHAPVSTPTTAAQISLGDDGGHSDVRESDRVTFDLSGLHKVLVKDVEYVDATLTEAPRIWWLNHYGTTTDGSIDEIYADVGNHEFHFTTAIKDTSLNLGNGWDQVTLGDQLDIPGTQYWSLIRRDDNEFDAYSLLTGKRVRMEDGQAARNGIVGYENFGEVEQLYLTDAETGGTITYRPGGHDLPNGGDRGTPSNIDLRTVEMVDPGTGYVATAQAFSDSFNLAYFNFIRYTSDNVWVGEATIHDGTVWSTPNDRTVTTAKYGVTAATLDEDAYPLLSTVLGTSRNGTHDLIVEEQATAIAGKLRLYTTNVQSELYNEFNDVFLGTSGNDSTFVNGAELYADNGTSAALATWSDRVALFGFGGNDSLTGGYGRDYIFGGEGTYNQLIGSHIGNRVTGGTGADYFGVGNTNGSGAVTGDNRIVVAVASGVTWEYSTDAGVSWTAGTTADWANGVSAAFTKPVGSFEVREAVSGKALSWFEQGYATDVISDWQAAEDTLVVLSNGTAVISGLQDANGTALSLSGANTFDLRDYAAIATSDQGADGARGGIYSQWDADADGIETVGNVLVQGYHIETLDDIYTNQSVRDAQAIANEAGEDVTVRNSGNLIVRGLGGSDIIYGSRGDDYIYGNQSNNSIYISNGGNDRVFYDTFDGTSSKHFVDGFTTFAVNSGEADKFYLNKRVVDSFNSNATYTARDIDITSLNNVNANYVQARAYDPGINFLHDSFYNPSIATSNLSHTQADGRGLFSNSFTEVPTVSGSDGTSSYIGLGMVIAGRALLGVPFVGPIIGGALIASGALLGGAGGVVQTNAHQNATYSGDVSRYLNVLTDTSTSTADGRLLKPAHNTTALDTSVRFLDFFEGVDVRDGYIPLVEFTAHSNQGLYGYFALHSNTHTFVYLVASRDNLVEDAEAVLVAQIEGILSATDFAVYDGNYDIYNYKPGGEPEIILREPTIEAISDSKATPDYGHIDGRIDDAQNPIILDVSVNQAVTTGSFFRIYDGATKIYDGNIAVAGQQVTMSLNGADYRFTDGRALGTTVKKTTNTTSNDDSLNDTYVLRDGRVSYTIELVDGLSGLPTRVTSTAITISGGNGIIDGGGGNQDILLINETSSFLNGFATDANGDNRLTGIETISLAPDPLVATSVSIVGGVVTSVSFAGNLGSNLRDGTYLLSISDEVVAPAVPGTGAIATVTVVGGSIQSTSVTSGGSGYSSSTQVIFTPGLVLNLTGQSEGFEIIGGSGADTITGGNGDDTITGSGGPDTIILTAGGADRLAYSYSSGALGVDDQYDVITGFSADYDVITGFSTDDVIYIRPSAQVDHDNDPGTATVLAPGFDDRDGDATRLAYETATLGADMDVASGTELLVVSDSSVSSAGDVTANIAAALDSAFNLTGLDGNAPSPTTGGGSDSSVLYAVRSDTGSYWVGRYEDIGNDDTISGNTEIEIFANVSSNNILDSFWLPTRLAPQALGLTLPSGDSNTGSGDLYTLANTFSVSGLEPGNRVYYSLDAGNNWQFASVGQTTINLASSQPNDIWVRQFDGANYSPETTKASTTVVKSVALWDRDEPTYLDGVDRVSLGSFAEDTFNGKPYFKDVNTDYIIFDFDPKSNIDPNRWGPGASDGTDDVANAGPNGEFLVVNSIRVHDLDNSLNDYSGGLSFFSAAGYDTDETGRLRFNLTDVSQDTGSTTPETRLYIDIDIVGLNGTSSNMVFDIYLDWANGIV